MSFDIGLLDTKTLADRGVAMPLRHLVTNRPLLHDKANPTDPDRPVTVTVHGKTSVRFQDWLKLTQFKRAEEARERLRNGRPALSQDEIDSQSEDDNRQMMIVCTSDWSFTALLGKPFPYNDENKQRFYTDPRFRSYTAQIFNFIMGDGNFLASSLAEFDDTRATSLSPTDRSRTTAERSHRSSEPMPV